MLNFLYKFGSNKLSKIDLGNFGISFAWAHGLTNRIYHYYVLKSLKYVFKYNCLDQDVTVTAKNIDSGCLF